MSQEAVHIGQQCVRSQEPGELIGVEERADLEVELRVVGLVNQARQGDQRSLISLRDIGLRLVPGVVFPVFALVLQPLGAFWFEQHPLARSVVSLEERLVDFLDDRVQAQRLAVALAVDRERDLGIGGSRRGNVGILKHRIRQYLSQVAGVHNVVVQVQLLQTVKLLVLVEAIEVDLHRTFASLLGHGIGAVPLEPQADIREFLSIQLDIGLHVFELEPKAARSHRGTRSRWCPCGWGIPRAPEADLRSRETRLVQAASLSQFSAVTCR